MVKKKLVNRRELAASLDPPVVMQTITKWADAGMPVAEPGRKGKPSLYDEDKVREWLANREKAAQKNGTVDLTRDRARKERAQAVLAEQTVAIRAKDLVPRVQVERAWAAEVSAVRAKLLAWPATISERLHRESAVRGVKGVERVIKEAAEGLLRELAEPLPWNWPCPLCGSKKITRAKPRGSGRRKK